MDTTEVLEEFLIQQKKKNDMQKSLKPKIPQGLLDLGM